MGSEFVAHFSAEPLFRIDSNEDGTYILVNGERKWLPWAFPADAYPHGITVEAPAIVPEDARDDVRYRFESWSGGGARSRRVTIPATGGSLSLNLTREYRLRAHARGRDETAVSIAPPSEDGFYSAGTQVVVTAVPPRGERFAGWTGEVSGSETALTVVMDAAKSVEAVFTRSQPLRPSEEQDVVLDAARRFALYSHEQGWHALVPRDAAEMTVRFQTSSAAEVDLYVNRGQPVWRETGEAGETPRIHAAFESTAPGANETITISRGSTPRLTNDVYFIALGAQPTNRRIRGTLSVEIRRSGIVRAWPPAATFVAPSGSDPDSQTVQLTHETASSVRYRVDSNRSWLGASPQAWVQTGPGMTEFAVAASSAGLANGTHKGELTVVQVVGESAQGEARATGIEIAVAFAVVPSNSSSRRVNGARITSRPLGGDIYGLGEEIEVSVDLVDPAGVTGTPTLALRLGSRIRQVEWALQGSPSSCGEGHKTLMFRYIVQADDRDIAGIDIPENALALNGGAIVDSNGTPAVLATAPLLNAADHKVDGSKVFRPEVDGLWIDSRPQDGPAYGASEEIRVQLRFSQPVEVAGNPTLAISVGGHTRQASFHDWWGDTLWFRYTVQPADRDADSISIAVDALNLSGGSIRSATGVDADLDLGAYALLNAADHKVDGSKATPPAVDGLWIHSRPQDGRAYGAGEEIRVQLRFSQPVEVAGNPTLAIGVGGHTRQASFDERWGKNVRFLYAVQSADRDTDGISIATDALNLNGGSIRNAVGMEAELDLGGHALVNAADHKVDGGG